MPLDLLRELRELKLDCIVGMSGSILDDAARSFAIGFYGGLGARESVEAAYKQGWPRSSWWGYAMLIVGAAQKAANRRSSVITTEEAARGWQKVVEKLYEHRFGETRRRLAELETKHGETDKTRDLAQQLDSLPEHYLRERGRGRKDCGD